MNTPIYEFVQAYRARAVMRLHMPGHKGYGPLGCEALDITEIEGADNLFAPEQEGVIAQSEANATALFGTAHTHYSAGGSSACIGAMLALTKMYAPAQRSGVFAARNVHKAFVHACGLLQLVPHWLYPEQGQMQGLCGCEITAHALDTSLAHAAKLPLAVYITSPDYLGNVADVAALAAVCKRYDTPLLVDNAHGAYLKFLPTSRHPMDLGAAMCCDSAHKTFPVLTGGAYLHLAKGSAIVPQDVKTALSLFSSTSPSYLILQSLDVCNAYLDAQYPEDLRECIARCDVLKETLRAQGVAVVPSEPLKLVFDCRAMPCGAQSLALALRAAQMEPEFVDVDYLVCMVTPSHTHAQWQQLEHVLCAAVQEIARCESPRTPCPEIPTAHPVRMSITQAMFARGERCTPQDAIGRVCRVGAVSCPPAIPIVISGEEITAQDAAVFAYYGIDDVEVVARA